jgi:hypothetical protein
VEGVLFLRPEHGFSEHGSVFGRYLLRCGGEIIGTPVVSFADAIALTNQDYDAALALVTGRVYVDPLDRPITTTVGTTTPVDDTSSAHRHDPGRQVEEEVEDLTPDIAARLAAIDQMLEDDT